MEARPVLARDYINEHAKTALAFIEPPPWMGRFRKHYQGKIFRTGDERRLSTHGCRSVMMYFIKRRCLRRINVSFNLPNRAV